MWGDASLLEGLPAGWLTEAAHSLVEGEVKAAMPWEEVA